jgi:hypothetical protein
MSPVGQYYSTLNCPLVILSKMKKYQMSMCCVLCPLEALSFFASRMHGTLIVLKDNVVMYLESLRFQKIASPDDQWHSVIHSDQFCFSRALSIEALFWDIEYMDPFLSDMVLPV